MEGIKVPSGKLVESLQLVNNKDCVKELDQTDSEARNFMEKVVKANLELVKKYTNAKIGRREG